MCGAGVYDFITRFTEEEQITIQPRLKEKLQPNGEWIGSAFASTDEDWLRASAVTHVDAMDPPMLLIHCEDDRVVPWMQSRDMHAIMAGVGIASEVEIVGEGGHGGPPTAKQSMITFFTKVLAGR